MRTLHLLLILTQLMVHTTSASTDDQLASSAGSQTVILPPPQDGKLTYNGDAAFWKGLFLHIDPDNPTVYYRPGDGTYQAHRYTNDSTSVFTGGRITSFECLDDSTARVIIEGYSILNETNRPWKVCTVARYQGDDVFYITVPFSKGCADVSEIDKLEQEYKSGSVNYNTNDIITTRGRWIKVPNALSPAKTEKCVNQSMNVSPKQSIAGPMRPAIVPLTTLNISAPTPNPACPKTEDDIEGGAGIATGFWVSKSKDGKSGMSLLNTPSRWSVIEWKEGSADGTMLAQQLYGVALSHRCLPGGVVEQTDIVATLVPSYSYENNVVEVLKQPAIACYRYSLSADEKNLKVLDMSTNITSEWSLYENMPKVKTASFNKCRGSAASQVPSSAIRVHSLNAGSWLSVISVLLLYSLLHL